jgi:hypothetical protein
MEAAMMRDDSEFNLKELGLPSEGKKIEVHLSMQGGSSSGREKSSERKLAYELENTFGKQAKSSESNSGKKKFTVTEYENSNKKNHIIIRGSDRSARTLEDESPKPRRLFQEKKKLNLSFDPNIIDVPQRQLLPNHDHMYDNQLSSDARLLLLSQSSSRKREIKMETAKKIIDSSMIDLIDMKNPQVKNLLFFS